MTVDNENPYLLFELKVAESKEERSLRVRQTLGFNNYNRNFRFRAFSPYNRYYSLYPRAYYYDRTFNYNNYSYGYTTRTMNYINSPITLNVLDNKIFLPTFLRILFL